MTKKVHNTLDEKKAHLLVAELKAGRFTVDHERFQREGSAWSTKQKEGYLKSLNRDMAHGEIILGDLDYALRYANQNNTSCKEHLEKLTSKGAEYSVIDGQHRLSCLLQFLSGELRINGELFDVNEELQTVEQPTYYGDLPKDIQDTFKFAQIPVRTFKAPYSGDSGCPEIYVNLHQGTDLTQQQIRRAFGSPIHDVIVEWTRASRAINGTYTSGKKQVPYLAADMGSNKSEEFILNALLYTHRELNKTVAKCKRSDQPTINAAYRNDFYYKGVPNGHVHYDASHVDRFSQILQVWDDLLLAFVRTQGRQVPAQECWKLLYLAEYVVDEFGTTQVHDVGGLVTAGLLAFGTVHNDAMAELQQRWKKWASGRNPDPKNEPKETTTFIKWIRTPNDGAYRQKVRSEMAEHFGTICAQYVPTPDVALDIEEEEEE